MIRTEAIQGHRELWDWLHKNPEYEKEDWPGWWETYNDYNCMNECFFCEYWSEHGKGREHACEEECIADWGEDGDCISLFDAWSFEESEEKRAEYAKRMRDIPIKEVK